MESSENPRELNLLTVPQAARLLSYSPRTIKEWIKQGRLPVFQLTPGQSGVRIAEEDLRRFIEEHKR